MYDILTFDERSPPDPAHFPYTTLFRSNSYRSTANSDSSNWPAVAMSAGSTNTAPRRLSASIAPSMRASEIGGTRLNSSHVSISYAVFCLKKKNHLCHLGCVAGRIDRPI